MFASKEMDEVDRERLSQLLSIPQDTMIVDEQAEQNQQTSISVDQDLFDELPLGFDWHIHSSSTASFNYGE